MPLSIDLRNLNEIAECVELDTVKANGKMIFLRESGPLYCLDGKATHVIQIKRIRSSCPPFGVGTMIIVRIAASADIKETTFNTAPKIMMLISETSDKKQLRMFKRALKASGGMIRTIKKQRPYYHRSRFLGEIIEETFYIY